MPVDKQNKQAPENLHVPDASQYKLETIHHHYHPYPKGRAVRQRDSSREQTQQKEPDFNKEWEI